LLTSLNPPWCGIGLPATAKPPGPLPHLPLGGPKVAVCALSLTPLQRYLLVLSRYPPFPTVYILCPFTVRGRGLCAPLIGETHRHIPCSLNDTTTVEADPVDIDRPLPTQHRVWLPPWASTSRANPASTPRPRQFSRPDGGQLSPSLSLQRIFHTLQSTCGPALHPPLRHCQPLIWSTALAATLNLIYTSIPQFLPFRLGLGLQRIFHHRGWRDILVSASIQATYSPGHPSRHRNPGNAQSTFLAISATNHTHTRRREVQGPPARSTRDVSCSTRAVFLPTGSLVSYPGQGGLNVAPQTKFRLCALCRGHNSSFSSLPRPQIRLIPQPGGGETLHTQPPLWACNATLALTASQHPLAVKFCSSLSLAASPANILYKHNPSPLDPSPIEHRMARSLRKSIYSPVDLLLKGWITLVDSSHEFSPLGVEARKTCHPSTLGSAPA